MSNKILSYHNDPKVKELHVNLAKKHYELDMLMSGTYGILPAIKGQKFKGCSVGCMAYELKPNFHTNIDFLHEIVAESAGWPIWFVELNDTMFEALPAGEREIFHVQLRERIPVGADLDLLFDYYRSVDRKSTTDSQGRALKCRDGLFQLLDQAGAEIQAR